MAPICFRFWDPWASIKTAVLGYDSVTSSYKLPGQVFPEPTNFVILRLHQQPKNLDAPRRPRFFTSFRMTDGEDLLPGLEERLRLVWGGIICIFERMRESKGADLSFFVL